MAAADLALMLLLVTMRDGADTYANTAECDIGFKKWRYRLLACQHTFLDVKAVCNTVESLLEHDLKKYRVQ